MSSSAVTVVAVDGPAASGKSTVSRRVAETLGFFYVDSGALYRGLTWKALRDGVAFEGPEPLCEMLARVEVLFYPAERVVRFTIDGEDPWEQLRSEPVRERVSDVAAVAEVRSFVVRMLRSTVRFGDLVMEGRDIGTVVFPETPFKFYLDADPAERARRRYLELARSERAATEGDVRDSLQRRDNKDASRTTAPLQIALGAQVIDSTAMSIEDVVRTIAAAVRTFRR
jgi:cytidylate kinase